MMKVSLTCQCMPLSTHRHNFSCCFDYFLSAWCQSLLPFHNILSTDLVFPCNLIFFFQNSTVNQISPQFPQSSSDVTLRRRHYFYLLQSSYPYCFLTLSSQSMHFILYALVEIWSLKYLLFSCDSIIPWALSID